MYLSLLMIIFHNVTHSSIQKSKYWPTESSVADPDPVGSESFCQMRPFYNSLLFTYIKLENPLKVLLHYLRTHKICPSVRTWSGFREVSVSGLAIKIIGCRSATVIKENFKFFRLFFLGGGSGTGSTTAAPCCTVTTPCKYKNVRKCKI
jgi:hypothetical protein